MIMDLVKLNIHQWRNMNFSLIANKREKSIPLYKKYFSSLML